MVSVIDEVASKKPGEATAETSVECVANTCYVLTQHRARIRDNR